MLFRTQFVFVVSILACIAIGAAGLFGVTAKQSEIQQRRIILSYESLSGYLELSGLVFRTFKQTRRDLFSGSGEFAFDLNGSRDDIFTILDRLETIAAEDVTTDAEAAHVVEQLHLLRGSLEKAFIDIQQAASLIQTGSFLVGRKQAIDVLEQQVDVALHELIDTGVNRERASLAIAESDIKRANRLSQQIAILLMFLSIVTSGLVLIIFSRRFAIGLRHLETGVTEFSKDNLDHRIALPGSDELSALANNFNAMADQLTAKRTALEDAQKDLEIRVTDRTKELSEANSALQDRDDLRRQFFADIGHELRTPVTAIRGEAEVALRSRTNKQSNYEDALKRVVSLTEQLTSYVTDLFLIAREQAGFLDFRQETVDLNETIQMTIIDMRSLVNLRKATIEFQPTNPSLMIQGDPTKLSQLLRILITNALEHTQAGVAITIDLSQTKQTAILRVRDDGPGLLDADPARIFDRFYKGKTNPNTTTSTGLGLAIAKSIVNAHNGTIMAYDVTPSGAEFQVIFTTHKTKQTGDPS